MRFIALTICLLTFALADNYPGELLQIIYFYWHPFIVLCQDQQPLDHCFYHTAWLLSPSWLLNISAMLVSYSQGLNSLKRILEDKLGNKLYLSGHFPCGRHWTPILAALPVLLQCCIFYGSEPFLWSHTSVCYSNLQGSPGCLIFAWTWCLLPLCFSKRCYHVNSMSLSAVRYLPA